MAPGLPRVRWISQPHAMYQPIPGAWRLPPCLPVHYSHSSLAQHSLPGSSREQNCACGSQPGHRALLPLRSPCPICQLPTRAAGNAAIQTVQLMKPAGSPPPIGRSPPARGRGRASGRAVLRAAQRPAGTPKTTGRAVLAGSQRATSTSRPRSRASSAARSTRADSSGTRP